MSGLHGIPPGLVHGLEYANFQDKAIVTVFLTVALFNSLELVVLVCWTFRRYQGLYFWSLLISSLGIIPYTVGSILHYYNVGPLPVGLPISYIGFLTIVPPQSFVLYSRLFLVFYNERVLRHLLDVIITVSVVLGILNTVMLFGSAFIRNPPWNYGYNVVERLQVTGFCFQELAISLLYIRSTVKLLRLSPEGKNRVKRILYELLGISSVVIGLDVAVIIIQYFNLYYLQVCFKPLVYSIKLKLEFAVLGRLVKITKTRRSKHQGRVARSEFIGPSYMLTDFSDTVGTGTRTSSSVEVNPDWSKDMENNMSSKPELRMDREIADQKLWHICRAAYEQSPLTW
ncbi:hypothetical protein BJY04DRAFT_208779 [Aspergillus karnatakaensis]|uniref:uncharacterized protein n=1 Tax=Aspergillus karnatakaensis TaxID=1810916 RepID=UPI003CCE42F9